MRRLEGTSNNIAALDKIWAVGIEISSDSTSGVLYALHASSDSGTYCESKGQISDTDYLWVDRAIVAKLCIPNTVCMICSNLRTRSRKFGNRDWIEIYAERSRDLTSDKFNHLMNLSSSTNDGNVGWEYMREVGRARFADGVGDLVVIWRTSPLE